MSSPEELTKRANRLYVEYQTRMTNDTEYRNSEMARYRLLDNTILELPFSSQVDQADSVTKGMVTESTQEDLLAWAKGQYHIYILELEQGVVNSTAICNSACVSSFLDNADWSKIYAVLHKNLFNLLKIKNQLNKQ